MRVGNQRRRGTTDPFGTAAIMAPGMPAQLRRSQARRVATCTSLCPRAPGHNASLELSPAEADVYKAVTTGVRDEMNRDDRTGDDKRRSSVGFALQVLQRQSVPLTRWAEE